MPHANPDHPPIALASKSARRLELLHDAGHDAIAVASGFDDADVPNVGQPDRLVVSLARSKAVAVTDRDQLAAQGRLIIAADTIAVSPVTTQPDGQPELLGQPKDRAEARRMLELMLGTTHQILTGIALLDPASRQLTLYAESASVYLGRIEDDRLEAYLDTDAWRGKAGAYNLFEIQDQWPVRIDGDPTTIVGLPMQSLPQRLEDFYRPLRALREE